MPENNTPTIEEFKEPLFPLGQIEPTPPSLETLEEADVLPIELLYRHQTGDWGELPQEDIQENVRALRVGARIFSRYKLPTEKAVYIITEWDRSVTTILLPTEY